jgi:hypothetical protein
MLCSVLVANEMAAMKAEMRAQEMSRARRVAAPEVRETSSDRGAQGPAMAGRGLEVVTVEADVHAPDGSVSFERSSVARVMDGVIDHYTRIGVLWGRRLEAVVTLAGHYQAGRVAPGTARTMGVRGYGEMNDFQAEEWKRYCQATDHLSVGVRHVVEDVARGRFPAALDAVSRLRDGASELADYFRLFPDKTP